jgi:transcription initiation factor TFIID subunit 1, fungi type
MLLHEAEKVVLIAEAESRPKSAHRYNVAEQQQIYKSEIERIWKAQFDSLSRKDEPPLTEDDERREREAQKAMLAPSLSRDPNFSSFSPVMSPIVGSAVAEQASTSRASSLERDRVGSLGPGDMRRVLRIKRKVNICLCSYSWCGDFNAH